MKFDCDKRKDRRIASARALEAWHTAFAFFPVRVGPNDCRWWETIERRRVWRPDFLWGGYAWEYRACP